MRTMHDPAFADWLRERRQRIEDVLESCLPSTDAPSPRLASAMRYATLGDGKRVRPLLAYAASELTGADPGRRRFARRRGGIDPRVLAGPR